MTTPSQDSDPRSRLDMYVCICIYDIYIYTISILSRSRFSISEIKKKNIQRTEKSLLSEFTRVSINKLRSNNNFASYEILGVYICSGLYVHWEQFFFFFR